jgi:hypothetical protein
LFLLLLGLVVLPARTQDGTQPGKKAKAAASC